MTPEVESAVGGIVRDAFGRVQKHFPSVEGFSEKQADAFLNKYIAQMGKRLTDANMAQIERTITRAEPMNIYHALQEQMATWGDSRAEQMARFEVMKATNDALIEGYKQAGYTSVWKAPKGECPACKALNGQTVTTLRPPLHKGCMCTVEAGARIEGLTPARFTGEQKNGKIEQTGTLTISDAQFGKKAGSHMREWGLDPSSSDDRDVFRATIDGIVQSAEEAREFEFRGQSDLVIGYIKGNDVVVTKKDGEFITILKDGISNKRFREGVKLK